MLLACRPMFRRPTGMARDAIRVLAVGGAVHVHRIDGYWLDIGTPAALARAQADHDLT